MPVSSRTLTVLAMNMLLAASRTTQGVRLRDLVDAVVKYEGRSLGAARVAVNREARALWKRGLVELHGDHWNDTMTLAVIERHEVAARAFANPEPFYRFAIRLRGDDCYGDASACVRAKARAAQGEPRMRVRRISITRQGMERITTVLGASAGAVIGPPAGLLEANP